jgi:uncharacterized protein involved in outer membrane biogenesis
MPGSAPGGHRHRLNMRTLFRWVFRILLVLVVVGILLGIGILLLKDSFAKSLAEKNLRDSTGMDAKISKLEVGLLTPTANLEGLKIYNSAEFGGGSFLEMPELRVEYVPEELREGKLHFKVLRLHIGEVHVVKTKDGRTNLDAIQKDAKKKSSGHKSKTNTPGVDFGGIDTVYLSVGKIVVTDLGNPKNNREIRVNLKDEVGRNLKTEAEVTAWFTFVVAKAMFQENARSGGTLDLGDLFQLFQGNPSRKR